jgi:hypothetical protein
MALAEVLGEFAHGGGLVTAEMADAQSKIIGDRSLSEPLHVSLQEDLMRTPGLSIVGNAVLRFQRFDGGTQEAPKGSCRILS